MNSRSWKGHFGIDPTKGRVWRGPVVEPFPLHVNFIEVDKVGWQS